jgi:hypothetical protein
MPNIDASITRYDIHTIPGVDAFESDIHTPAYAIAKLRVRGYGPAFAPDIVQQWCDAVGDESLDLVAVSENGYPTIPARPLMLRYFTRVLFRQNAQSRMAVIEAYFNGDRSVIQSITVHDVAMSSQYDVRQLLRR